MYIFSGYSNAIYINCPYQYKPNLTYIFKLFVVNRLQRFNFMMITKTLHTFHLSHLLRYILHHKSRSVQNWPPTRNPKIVGFIDPVKLKPFRRSRT